MKVVAIKKLVVGILARMKGLPSGCASGCSIPFLFQVFPSE